MQAQIAIEKWNDHADQMIELRELIASIARSAPCQCGDCLACRQIAALELDAAEAARDAILHTNALAAAGAFLPTMANAA